VSRVEIVPSVLAADFARLGEEVRAVEEAGADRIQVDVMDGHFVPNLSMGPGIVAAIRKVTHLPLEVHLMVEKPELYLEAFAAAGADLIQVQVESTYQLYRALQRIRELGKRAGVAINPATPVLALTEILPYVEEINVMTVEPGFGGQSFIPSSPDKIRRVRELAPDIDIEVDGGIDVETAGRAVAAGANVLVAGSSVYGHPGGAAAGVRALREAIG
jgi:ribulose-phosphate 3-epimerase